jgi:hypothetical protein
MLIASRRILEWSRRGLLTRHNAASLALYVSNVQRITALKDTSPTTPVYWAQ